MRNTFRVHRVELHELPMRTHRGALWRIGDNWLIYLNSNDSPLRKKFTLFHEGFHILARRYGGPVSCKVGSSGSCFAELLADYFASCVLMPRKWVEEKWLEVGNLDSMSRLFDVPKLAVWFRLKRLCLIGESPL